LGVGEFNRLCRESVFKYRSDWERLSARMGYWLDYDHPYVTYSNEYVESVWWSLKTLFDKELLYRGHKILPYCPRCGTALSSHELSLGYQEDEDPSVFVALTALVETEPPAVIERLAAASALICALVPTYFTQSGNATWLRPAVFQAIRLALYPRLG